MLIGVGAQGAPRDLVQEMEIAKPINSTVRAMISHTGLNSRFFDSILQVARQGYHQKSKTPRNSELVVENHLEFQSRPTYLWSGVSTSI